ncbi:MAG TPA: amino acid permease, partial [Blastococcus sp.]
MVARPEAASPKSVAGEPEPTLRADAVGFLDALVIGLAATSPAYSLAAVLGPVVALVGVHAPGVLLASFVPMLLIAGAFAALNRADPDCGTTFSWATRAFGPSAGWISGWAIVVADIIVMANLAQIAGLYSFLLFDSAYTPSTALVTAVGVVWIAVMTWICVVGIELSARTQVGLLAAEVLTLALFAVVALVKVYAGDAPSASMHPQLSWLSPFEFDSFSTLTGGVLLGV